VTPWGENGLTVQVLIPFGTSPHCNSQGRWTHQRTTCTFVKYFSYPRTKLSSYPKPKIYAVGTNETHIWHWHEWPKVWLWIL